jgi:Protein of unknown function (DUF2442)
MVEITDAELRAAEARGREMLATEPRASTAYFDQENRSVTVELVNGCSFRFPVDLVQDLHGASEEALAEVAVDSVGYNLHWPALDVDLYVPALVAGVFGTRQWMAREMPRIARQARSPAKPTGARKRA